MNNFIQVAAMHQKFGIKPQPYPALIGDSEFMGRMEMVLEEIVEALRDHRNGDLAGVADSLIDCAVFLMGTAHLMGLPWDALFTEVMRANLTKERGTGKRRNKLDLIKPEGWTPPDIEGILLNALLKATKGAAG